MNVSPVRLSLCMIVRDEEAFLGKCLDSIKAALVDEIIIVDTGSTDRTVEIARSYGAKIFHHNWENDYSKHRNRSISYASGDWILIMDADEVIAVKDIDKILSLLARIEADGFMFTLRNYESNCNLANLTINTNDYDEGRGYPGFIPSDLIRIFKNDSNIYFTGKVHETVTESFRKSNKIVYNTGIPIHHYGKVCQDRTTRKQELYLRLGVEGLKENPYDAIGYKGLADQYLDLGMPDKALEVLNRGVGLFPDMLKLRFNRGLALDKLNIREEAKNEYLWVLEREPDHLGACHNLAQLYFSDNQFEKVIELLNRGVDVSLVHPAIFFLLGRAYLDLGDWEKALISFDRVVEVQPNWPDVNCYRAMIFLNRDMYDAALDALEKEIKNGGNVAGAYNLLGQISFTLKDMGSAMQFFQKVLTINPDDATAKAYLERIRCNGRLNNSQ